MKCKTLWETSKSSLRKKVDKGMPLSGCHCVRPSSLYKCNNLFHFNGDTLLVV